MEKLEDLSKLQKFFDADPVGTQVIRNLAAGHPESEYFCDDPSDPVYIFRNHGFHGVFSAMNEKAVESFIPHIPEQEIMFAGVRTKWADIITSGREPAWHTRCHLLWYPHESIDLVEQHPVRDLTPGDVDLINRHWELGGGKSEDYILERIENGIHAGCDDEEGLVSWALIHFDGSMGFLYTMERGRRKSYARSTAIGHVRKILDAGRVPFGYVLLDNDASLAFSRTMGLVQDGYASYFGYPPPLTDEGDV